jgi:hypothetical protein
LLIKLNKSISELTVWESQWEVILWYNPLVLQGLLGVAEVCLRGNDIVIHAEVWDEVILWMLVHVGLELCWSSGLFLATDGSASWDRLFLDHLVMLVVVLLTNVDGVNAIGH